MGKQRLALWLAQLVLCERRRTRALRRHAGPVGWSRGLAHADVHWFVPILAAQGDGSGQAGGRGGRDAGRDHGGAAEAAAVRRAGRDGHPLRSPSVRLLQRRAALTSVEGGRRVFIIGDADRLVPQESSPEAANALAQAAGGAAGGSAVRPDDARPAAAAADDPLPRGAGAAEPAERRRGAGLSGAAARAALERAELEERVRARRRVDRRWRSAQGEEVGKALPGRRSSCSRRCSKAAAPRSSERCGRRPSRRAATSPPCSTRWRTRWARRRAARWDSRSAGRVPPALLRHRTPAAAAPRDGAGGRGAGGGGGNVNPQLLLAVLGEELAEVL